MNEKYAVSFTRSENSCNCTPMQVWKLQFIALFRQWMNEWMNCQCMPKSCNSLACADCSIIRRYFWRALVIYLVCRCNSCSLNTVSYGLYRHLSLFFLQKTQMTSDEKHSMQSDAVFCIPYQALFPHIFEKKNPGSSQVGSPGQAKWPHLLKVCDATVATVFEISIWKFQDIIRL